MKTKNSILLFFGTAFTICIFSLCGDIKKTADEQVDKTKAHINDATELITKTVDEVTNTESPKQEEVDDNSNSCECKLPKAIDGITVKFNSTVPGDINNFTQANANCFAWQQFIALNWPKGPNTNFGDPGDLKLVQWETYMPKDVLFQPNAAPPPPWGTTLIADHHTELMKKSRINLNPKDSKLLFHPSKFGKSNAITGLDIHQAAPQKGPNWLGAQNNTNVWYEIMINEDHYNFINNNGYYDAAVQHDSVNLGVPINFPKGSVNGPVGAIELKAAWMEIDDPSNNKWSRYKLSNAAVQDPTSGQLRKTIVALVGFHILHKTENQPTWVWSTFEQIDNVPGNSSPPDGYNFHNNNCTNRTVNLADGSSVEVVCNENQSPPYSLTQAPPVPTQISRHNPIDATAVTINKLIQENIKKFYPNSVWQYYQLVDVIWSAQIQPDPSQPIPSPRNINVSAMTSGANVVANTTLESYAQTTTCFQCHKYSTIAPFPPDAANNNVFGDFSFVIGAAKYHEQ